MALTEVANTSIAGSDAGEKFPPGTFRLIDTDGNMRGRHADGEGQDDIMLVPQPSLDPEDPLNWTFKRKVMQTFCVVLYTIVIAIPSSAVYSIVTPLRADTGLSLQDVNNGTGIMVRTSHRNRIMACSSRWTG
jgi:hypothetical protein